jgi:uncharacterized protein
MKTLLKNFILLILFLGNFPLPAADVPYLTGRVTDNAEILSESTRQSLTAMLKAHEDRTGNQIAVLTIPTIGGEGIEEYAVEVFNTWKLGQEDKDNGVLIVVVPHDRRMRIEVGYGLEATLTDAMAGRIIRSVMTPKFKNGDYDGGVTDGTKAIVAVLEGGELAEVESSSDGSEESSSLDMDMPDIGITERILLGAFIFGIIGLFTVVGVLTPGAGWFLYIFLIPFWAVFPIIVVGTSGALTCLIAYIIGFPLVKLFLKNKDWYKKARKDLRTKGKASIGGFSFSSGSSGGSWSSGSSGFSGGGGSSGGGGASGSW